MDETALYVIGKTLAGIAGEPCDVQDISGTVYVFCGELGTLRCLHELYKTCGDRVKAGYSENRQSFYFRLEPAI